MLPKILLLSDIFPPKTGGTGRLYWEIYSRLPRDRILVAAGEGPGADEFDRTHDPETIRLPIEMRTRGIRSFRNLQHYWTLASRVGAIVGREGITAIHCARNLPEGFVAYLVRKRRGTEYLCYAHGEDIGVSSTSRELAWMTRRVFAAASLVIASSQNTRDMLLNEWGLPDSKVRHFTPGVDTRQFAPAPPDEIIRAELGWAGRTVLLTVGRLQKRKGQDCLIRALKEIRRTHPDVLYAVLGDGDELPQLQALADAEGVAGNVQFLGGASDEILRRCYQQCDLFVLPNRTVGRDFEGFGMVLLEAQACGKPVVAGASGGTAETMRIPETGRVVACDTPGPLAALLTELLSDPAELRAMGARGREWVCAHFDWDALSRRAAELFSEVPRS